MIKKIATFMIGIGLIASSSLAFVSAADGSSNTALTTNTFSANGLKYDTTTVKDISWVAGVKEATANDWFLSVVKNAINWILGMLGLITFVLLLWGGFNMVTAAGDDKKFGEGLKILKNAGIGLLFIAVSWLLVSMLFWVINGVTWQ